MNKKNSCSEKVSRFSRPGGHKKSSTKLDRISCEKCEASFKSKLGLLSHYRFSRTCKIKAKATNVKKLTKSAKSINFTTLTKSKEAPQLLEMDKVPTKTSGLKPFENNFDHDKLSGHFNSSLTNNICFTETDFYTLFVSNCSLNDRMLYFVDDKIVAQW